MEIKKIKKHLESKMSFLAEIKSIFTILHRLLFGEKMKNSRHEV